MQVERYVDSSWKLLRRAIHCERRPFSTLEIINIVCPGKRGSVRRRSAAQHIHSTQRIQLFDPKLDL